MKHSGIVAVAGRLLGLWVLAGAAAVASAGTLCGTVRDAQTQAPVARAGVFVRTTAGAYTGLHAATANDGSFCLNDVPAGTWDLEVRVDHYAVSWLRNVVVTDGASGVDLQVPTPSVRLGLPYPNPAQGRVWFAFELRESGPVRLVVHDLRGRLVRGWESDLAAGPHEVQWDLRAAGGARIADGVYFVRLTAGGETRERTLAVGGGR